MQNILILLFLIIIIINPKYDIVTSFSINTLSQSIKRPKPMISNNSTEIYHLLQEILPELKKQNIPINSQDFSNFYKWMNEQYSYIQYVELKEYDNNGISNSQVFKSFNVDTKLLEDKINRDVGILWGDYENMYTEKELENLTNLEEIDLHLDIHNNVEDILFNHIKQAAEEKNLKLFVIIRENPYWFVLPNNPDKNQKIVDKFNQTFAKKSNLELMLY